MSMVEFRQCLDRQFAKLEQDDAIEVTLPRGDFLVGKKPPGEVGEHETNYSI